MILIMEQLLTRGVEEVIEREHLEERLKNGDKLRVKLGIDPTAKDLHLGHTVVLRKLRQFQDAGHQAVFIIGDFTATIGDPSGRSELRPTLTVEQIQENLKNYLTEAGKVIDIKKAEVRYNSEWYKDKKSGFLMELSSKFTVARMLERDDFQKRLKSDQDVGLLEILYPILQGYDSLEVKADVELGGTDQKFNLLMGRKVQKRYDMAEQDIITCPLIEGLDGVKKMSKSLGNYVGLSDTPDDMFGKIMSVPDELMVKYFTLLTDVAQNKIDELKKDMLEPSMATKTPRAWKEELATEIVAMYHGASASKEAAAEFNRVFSRKELPENIEEFSGDGQKLSDFIMVSGSQSSTSAKRLIDQGAVKINEVVIKDWGHTLKTGDIVQVGPRKFARVK
jgi:tyrosyl-tRNA synthetase